MLDDALRQLRFDRRMLERRGWTSRDDVARALADLPDVSVKAAPTEPAPSETAGSES